jgi:methylmalonyl-CoA/ethylmalonyl-CoA epimerase
VAPIADMVSVCLHHIGIVVRSIPEAAAAYSDRYGYEVRSEIIHDPTQTAYVQFLRLPADPCYLELVCPDGPKSKLRNALNKGGGLNHIGYATEVIEWACKQLSRQGMFLIQPPVPAVAFSGRRIAWLIGRGCLLTELVEKGPEVEF